MTNILTDAAVKRMENEFQLKREAIRIFLQVVAEWESDPMSVQCFDLRMVNRAKDIAVQIEKIDPLIETIQ